MIADFFGTTSIVGIAANILGITIHQVYEAYGEYFITKSVQGQGYAKLLLCVGSSFVEFLRNLNAFHLHLLLGFEDRTALQSNASSMKMIPPAFRCQEVGTIQRLMIESSQSVYFSMELAMRTGDSRVGRAALLFCASGLVAIGGGAAARCCA